MRKFIFLLLPLISLIFAYGQTPVKDSLVTKRQKANESYASIYLENSELSYTSPMGELGAPSKYVINGKLTTSYMVLSTKTLPIAFSINPDFTVRVREEKSAGVRTPSFRLGGTLYIRLAKKDIDYRYVELSFTHHSNGQDGSAILPNGEINTINGNFNTNYLTASYRFGHHSDFTRNTSFGFHHKMGLQWHKWFDSEPALADEYGFTRLNYDLSFRIYKKINEVMEKEQWRVNGSFSYAINSLPDYQYCAAKKRLNAELSINYSFPFMQNVFLMTSFGYYGEDPYNIYFKDRYAYARFGLSSTFLRSRAKKG